MRAVALLALVVAGAAMGAESVPAKPVASTPGPPKPGPTVPAAPARAAADAGASPSKTITLRGDRLTVQVTDVPLDDVLKAVAEPGKAEVRGSVQSPRNITAEFSDVALQDGLTRLLGEQNFLLTYREDGTLRSLTLLGGPIEPSAETKVVKTTAPTVHEPPPASPAEMLQRSVPVGGKLQQLLGQPTATLQQLMDVALRQDDASLRLEAARTGMSAIDAQPDLRATAVKSLEGVDDQVLENLVRSLAHDRAQELMSQLAATTRTPEIRARSLQLLRSLGSSGGEE